MVVIPKVHVETVLRFTDDRMLIHCSVMHLQYIADANLHIWTLR